VEIENLGDTDLRSIGRKILFAFIGRKKHLLSFFKEIRYRRTLRPFNDIVFLTSASVKERLFSFDAHLSNEAKIGATFAFKRCLFIMTLTQVKPFET
jgi:hypothetical protein